jgi:NADPH-dependent ferric siderophore reductase
VTRATRSVGAAAKSPGRLSKAVIGLFMKRATIAAIEELAPRFRLVTLEGTPLQNVTWAPGQKLQIAMSSAFVARTYTPIDWDKGAGRTRLLGYAHGEGPGSAWLLGLVPGDECDVFGPRPSLDTGRAAPPLALFGDETSIGLAHALVAAQRIDAVRCLFEIGDVGAGRAILTRLGLDDATLIARCDDGRHLDALEDALGFMAVTGASFVLTGQASAIQRLRQHLRAQGVPASRILTKAYWAHGKRGLD